VTRLRLLTRPECHLCEVAARDLTRLGIAFDTIDVDMDEVLVSRFGDMIPVILDGEREIVRAPFTLPVLRRSLEQAGITAKAL
jgi:glutaredoxin